MRAGSVFTRARAAATLAAMTNSLRALLVAAVFVFGAGGARGDEGASWPATAAAADALTRAQLAALPDVKVPLGKPLAQGALTGAPLVKLKLMRNSIYAQYGVPFKTRWLRDYFESRSWYKALDKPEKVVAGVDLDNARAILKREHAMGGDAGARTVDLAHITRLTPDEMKALPDYRLPLDKTVDVDALRDKPLIELKLLRNSVFAQRGKGDFHTPWLKAYYGSRAWYHPLPTMRALSKTDAQNVAVLKRLEDTRTPGDATAARILDAGSCTRGRNEYFFGENGQLDVEEPGEYPWSRSQVDGAWRVDNGHLEVKLAGTWQVLKMDFDTNRCR